MASAAAPSESPAQARSAVVLPYTPFSGSRDPDRHYARLCLPSTGDGPFPIVANIHGGFWKEEWPLTRIPTERLLAAFTASAPEASPSPGANSNSNPSPGPSSAPNPTSTRSRDRRPFATLEIEYSRADQREPSHSLGGGGWPLTALDTLAAIDAACGSAEIDTSQMWIVGHSAGGQLALWLGCVLRLAAPQLDAVVADVTVLAGAEAGLALKRVVSARRIGVRGVAAVAAVSDLRSAAAAGLSDLHDAVPNFFWRCGPHPPDSSLDAACPTSLYAKLPMLGIVPSTPTPIPTPTPTPPASTSTPTPTPTPTPTLAPTTTATAPTPLPPLRVLLIHGTADVNVPAEQSVAFAAAAWARTQVHPLWLQMIPGADHFAVVAIGADAGAAAAHWAQAAAALAAFVSEDDAALAGLCVSSADAALELLRLNPPPTPVVAAAVTCAAIDGTDPGFAARCEADRELWAAYRRGLSRWVAWQDGAGAPAASPAVRSWLSC